MRKGASILFNGTFNAPQAYSKMCQEKEWGGQPVNHVPACVQEEEQGPAKSEETGPTD